MKKRILVIKVMLTVLLLLSGFGYAGYIYYGYAKGQNEYKILQEEYTWPAGEAKDFADKSAPTPEEKNKKENDELSHKIPTFARQIPKQTHGKVIQGTTESIV